MTPTAQELEKAISYYYLLTGRNPTTVSPYLDGLGNVVIRLDNLVVRLKIDNSLSFYNKENERKTLFAASGASLSPKIIYFNPTDSTIVYQHFEGKKPLDKDMDERRLYKLGLFLKMLHSLSSDGLEAFDAKKRFDIYKGYANVVSPFPQEKELRKRVEDDMANSRQVLSHNDIVKGNLLEENEHGKFALIDFEYAGCNSEMFDIASALSENKIEKIEQKKAILQGYFENINEMTIKKCNDYILYEDLLWYYWGLAKYKATGNYAFYQIAKEKREAISLHSSFFHP